MLSISSPLIWSSSYVVGNFHYQTFLSHDYDDNGDEAYTCDGYDNDEQNIDM